MASTDQIAFPETRYSGLITQEQPENQCHYLVLKKFVSGHASLTTIKLEKGDRLRRGGGAGRKNESKASMDAGTLQKSISRARRSVREKSHQLCVDRMLTLTFKENVTDIDLAWSRFKYFAKLCRKRFGKRWAYVAVPEYQKRGAVHFHLALSGYYPITTMRRLWLRAVGQLLGNVHITSPKKYGKNSWNPKRIAGYISKYLSKVETVTFNKRRYSSGGEIPPVEKATGFVGIGLPMMRVADQILRRITRKQIESHWEGEHYFALAYYST